MDFSLPPLTLQIPWFPHPKQIDNARNNSSIQINQKRNEAIGVELARAEAFFLDCFAIDKIVEHIVAGIEVLMKQNQTLNTLKFEVISTGHNDMSGSHNWSGLTRTADEDLETISRPIEGSVIVDVRNRTFRYDFIRNCIGYAMILSLDDDKNTMQSYPFIDTGFGYGHAIIDFTDSGLLKIVDAEFSRTEDSDNATNPFSEEGDAALVKMNLSDTLEWEYRSQSTNVS